MRMLASCLAALALAGCASLETVRGSAEGKEGLTYYMPMRDFVFTITYDSGKVTKATLTESAAYPDLAHPYLLRYSRNLFGKNAMNLGVNEKGLLTSASSNTTSGVSDTLKSLASTVGTFHAIATEAMLAAAKKGEGAPCDDGDNVLVIAADEPDGGTLCNVHITVKKLGEAQRPPDPKNKPPKKPAPPPATPSDGTAVGIYYRQSEPYEVTAKGAKTEVQAILFSPSNAPTRFLPVYPSVFANNTATFAFNDGMPTAYNIDTDGEVIALLKLPADIVSAYFAAVGAVFDSFKAADANKAAVMDAQVKLQIERQKYEACLAAISAGNADLVTKLGC